MLANPIVVPAYAEPIVWMIALVAMWAEVHTVLSLLRRGGSDVRGLPGPMVAINVTTWFPFLVALDCIERWPLPEIVSITLLEIAVVLVETGLLHSATRGRVFTRGLPCTPLTWPRALFVSFVGNIVSVAVSLGAPFAIWLFGRWR